MSTVHSYSEADLRERALDHDCPSCGAKAGVRCRVVTKRSERTGYPAGTKVDVRAQPCPDRARLAWRQMLDAADGRA
jgi:hypothetical protein